MLGLLLLDMQSRDGGGRDHRPAKRERRDETSHRDESMRSKGNASLSGKASYSSSSSGSKRRRRETQSAMSISFLLNDPAAPQSPSRSSDRLLPRWDPSVSLPAGPSVLAQPPPNSLVPVLNSIEQLQDGTQPLPKLSHSSFNSSPHLPPLSHARSAPTLSRAPGVWPLSLPASSGQVRDEGSAPTTAAPQHHSEDPRWCSHCNRRFARTLSMDCMAFPHHEGCVCRLRLTCLHNLFQWCSYVAT